jgi:acyl-CoA synthetase (AMP-forming)/AMP-acid ligase II/thioesterase domain-containing protein/acyl carrier protein
MKKCTFFIQITHISTDFTNNYSLTINLKILKTGKALLHCVYLNNRQSPISLYYFMIEKGLSTIRNLIFSMNQDPEHNAIESPGYEPLTYRELRLQVRFVVQTLTTRGYHRNDRIAVITPAGPETAVAIISVMSGFTAVPLNPQYKEQEYQNYFSQLKVKAILVQKNMTPDAVRAAESMNIPVIELIPIPGKAGKFGLEPAGSGNVQEPEFASPTDISHVFFTSGTTSRPKIVPLSQKQIVSMQHQHSQTLGIRNTDRCLHIVPYYHGMGIGPPLLCVLLAGGTVICPREFIPSDFPSLLKEFRPTYYSAGPALHQGILREIKKMSPEELKNHSLRFIRSGSAALPPHARQELEALLGVVMIEAYAMTEAGEISVNFPPKPGSVGRPVIEHLKITDENGNELKAGQQGEILVRGDTVFAGYEDNPDENKAAFLDGWFRTGDMGYLDDEGYLFYTGRKKELINKGGEKISPVEVDTVLMTHHGVKQAMAFRIHDPVLGEDIAAMVVLSNPDTTKDELNRFLLERLAPFKVPRGIYVVDEICKGPTGKLLRSQGTDRCARGEFKESSKPAVCDNTVSPSLLLYQERLLRLWKESLDISAVSPDDDFFLSGGNSLSAVELLIKLQRTFEVALPPETVYLYPTIRQQAVLLAGKTGTGKNYHPLIVPIREQGSLPPLICIHSVGGWIGTYQNIFRHFHQDRPVFGIRARGLEPGEQPHQTITDAVREYADAVRSVQGEGPYHLIGFSAGAIYAFELACLLQDRGEPVAWLGNIDQSVRFPGQEHDPVFERKGAIIAAGSQVYRRFFHHLKKNPDGILHRAVEKGKKAFAAHVLHTDEPPPFEDWVLTYPERQQPLIRAIRKALREYQPRIFSGDLRLFSTGQDRAYYPGDVARGWNAFITGKTIVFEIPGDHGNLYLDPHAQSVARKIEESLKTA